MRIYLDEDVAHGLLARLLRTAGHDLEICAGAGLLGRSDAIQFRFAMHECRVCLTANYDDYE